MSSLSPLHTGLIVGAIVLVVLAIVLGFLFKTSNSVVAAFLAPDTLTVGDFVNTESGDTQWSQFTKEFTTITDDLSGITKKIGAAGTMTQGDLDIPYTGIVAAWVSVNELTTGTTRVYAVLLDTAEGHRLAFVNSNDTLSLLSDTIGGNVMSAFSGTFTDVNSVYTKGTTHFTATVA
jgi:hypothetical protein